MCIKVSINISEKSDLLNFNAIIKEQNNLDQTIANMLCGCKKLRCSYLLKRKSQSIKTKIRQCLQIKNSMEDKMELRTIRALCKKRKGGKISKIITECQQQCPEIEKNCRRLYATIFNITGKMHKYFYLRNRNYFSHQTQQMEQQQNDPPIQQMVQHPFKNDTNTQYPLLPSNETSRLFNNFS